MNFELFQVCFKEEHFKDVDIKFKAYDNLENKNSGLREYPIMMDLYNKNNDKLDAWGTFGPTWQKKLRYSSIEITETITSTWNDYDIWIFNPARIVASLTRSPWSMGNMSHPGLLNIGHYLLSEAIPKDSKINLTQCLGSTYPTEILCYANYFVAKKEFWKKYLEWIYPIAHSMIDEKLPRTLINVYRNAHYATDEKLTMFSFVIERMLSTYLFINDDISFYSRPVHLEEYYEGRFNNFQLNPLLKFKKYFDAVDLIRNANVIKNIAIKNKNPELLTAWGQYVNFLVEKYPNILVLDDYRFLTGEWEWKGRI